MTRGRIRMAVPVILVLCAAAAPAPFDYYVLSLSWAPDYCTQPGVAAANPKECATGRGTGFVVHGFWPETAQGKSPESCGPAQRVAGNVVKIALPYMLSASLIQHEWDTHGTCTGLSPGAYFLDVIQARGAVQIPVQMTSVEVPLTESPALIEDQFAAANAAFPKNAFRVVCRSGGVSEIRACFSRDLKPTECPASAGECRAPGVNVRPVR